MSSRGPKRSWLECLQFGLPAEFDFAVLRTPDDAARLVARLPSCDRGDAARIIFDQAGRLDSSVAHRVLLEAWLHDHDRVLKAFDDEMGFDTICKAFRKLAAPTTRRIRVWRGCTRAGGWYGLSWTLNRDCACWFATRAGNASPFVYVCDVEPSMIAAEYNEQSEHEVIVDIDGVHGVCLDESAEYKRAADDACAPTDVSAVSLRDWKAAGDRWAASIKSQNRKAKKPLI
jgi:hypothetical protein